MRRLYGPILLGLLSGGCMGDAVTLVDTYNWSRLKPKIPDVTPDVVELHYIFLQRPADDPVLRETIWADADEQAIPLDVKTTLNSNGLRLGKLGCTLSQEILELLDSSSPNGEGRWLRTTAGSIAKVQTTEVLAQWNLFVVTDGPPRGEELADAQGYFYIRPTLAEGNSVILSIAPEIEFGPHKHRNEPAADLSGWRIRSGRESRSFSELKVELSVTSGDYLLIGGLPDCKGTLGHYFFASTDGVREQQSVMLVRAIRPSREELYSAGYRLDDFFLTPIRQTVGNSRRSSVRETVHASKRIEEVIR